MIRSVGQEFRGAYGRNARCYLRALADHDTGGLLEVADGTAGPIRITSADFRHSADARSGVATATVITNQIDDADVLVTIVFADHAREDLAMGLANPASGHSWRLGIGTQVNSGGEGRAPTQVRQPKA